MLRVHPDSRYADVMERALHNGVLAGISLDGMHFFYVNPLEVVPALSAERHDTMHALPERPGWFSCACCPTNVVRMLLSLGQYPFQVDADRLYIHSYANCTADVVMDGQPVHVKVSGNYPWEGQVEIRPGVGRYTLMLRIPDWSPQYHLSIDGTDISEKPVDGYLRLERAWTGSEHITLTLDMTPRRIYANPLLRAASGQVAVAAGPLVYCLEEVDNGPALQTLLLPDDVALTKEPGPDGLGGIVALHAGGLREQAAENMPLYSGARPVHEPTELVFVPYYAWANRGANEMRVWVRSGGPEN